MTDAPPRPRPPRRPGPFPVAAATLAGFLAVLALLASQVRAGRDPALGPGPVAQAPAPRQVIVHRIVERRVVETAPPAAPSAGAPASAPTRSAPAPAPARAATPAPAPKRAPAPVVTRAS